MSLLFARGSAAALRSRVLLVSGTDDWVVPPDPEAIAPFRASAQRSNSLVLVKGGDHFNLRPGSSKDGGVLAPLLVKWSDAAFAAAAAGETHNGSEPLVLDGAWGSSQIPMADVTSQVRGNQ
jgi:predicted dienelactone hydrolase